MSALPIPPRDHERSLQLALAAARTAAENRGQDIVLLDLRELTPVFDFFVLVTGSSGRQLRAMSEEIDNVLEKQLGDKRMGIEGFQDSKWILLDYGSIVIHLLDRDMRKYYDLENLWAAAKRIDLQPHGILSQGAASRGAKPQGATPPETVAEEAIETISQEKTSDEPEAETDA